MHIYDAFTKGKFPESRFKSIHNDCFGKDEPIVRGIENPPSAIFSEPFIKNIR